VEPRIITRPAARVVGILVVSTMEPNLCPTAWEQFVPRMPEVEISGECLGIARWDYPGLAEGQFAYMAGFVSSMQPPTGMEAWEIDSGDYAEVTVSNLDSIRPAIGELYEKWLPTSEYVSGSLPYLEVYPEEFPHPQTLKLCFSVTNR